MPPRRKSRPKCSRCSRFVRPGQPCRLCDMTGSEGCYTNDDFIIEAECVTCGTESDSASVAHTGTPPVGSGMKTEQACGVNSEVLPPRRKPLKCIRCGKIVSRGRPCRFCTMTGKDGYCTNATDDFIIEAESVICGTESDSTSVAHPGTPSVGSGMQAGQAYAVNSEVPTPTSRDAGCTESVAHVARDTEMEELRKSRKKYREEAIRLRTQVRDMTIKQGQLAEEAKLEESTRRAAEKRAAELHEEMKRLRVKAQASQEKAARSDRLRKEAVEERDRCQRANHSLIEYSRKLRTMVQDLRGELKVNYAALKAIQDAAEELSLITKNAVNSSSVDDPLQPIPSPPSPVTVEYSDASETGADNGASSSEHCVRDGEGGGEPQAKKIKQEDQLLDDEDSLPPGVTADHT